VRQVPQPTTGKGSFVAGIGRVCMGDGEGSAAWACVASIAAAVTRRKSRRVVMGYELILGFRVEERAFWFYSPSEATWCGQGMQ
jgi:hypothetical protein